jgi:hypothetical protein
MARTRNVCFGLVILANLLAGCATVACDPDDPKFGKDCYECTRKATLEASDPDTGNRVSSKDRINDRTEECLRERGYIKQKQENRPKQENGPSLPPSMGY